MMRPIPDPYWKPGDSMDAQHPVLKKEPYIVVLVDEFADLMMTVGKKSGRADSTSGAKKPVPRVSTSVLATQRPSVDVITGLIKANIPTRIAFTVSVRLTHVPFLIRLARNHSAGDGGYALLWAELHVAGTCPWCFCSRSGSSCRGAGLESAWSPTVC